MRTLTCKYKIWGKNRLYLRPYLKVFRVFNVLETCRVYYKKIYLVVFLKKAKFVGMDKITYVQKM